MVVDAVITQPVPTIRASRLRRLTLRRSPVRRSRR
jgi:hypothetical protein